MTPAESPVIRRCQDREPAGYRRAKPLRARLRRKLSPGRNVEAWKRLSFATAGRKLKLRRHSD
jgi:hypothetical protein